MQRVSAKDQVKLPQTLPALSKQAKPFSRTPGDARARGWGKPRNRSGARLRIQPGPEMLGAEHDRKQSAAGAICGM